MPDTTPDTNSAISPDSSSDETAIQNGAGAAPEAPVNLTGSAHELSESATAAAMMAASDLTRAVDAEIIADRLATLSEIVGVAGVNDVEQGAALIAASDDVEAVSAAIGLMTVDDLDKGLELGRMSGELQILASIVDDLEMSVLSSVLAERAERLAIIAKETIVRAAASRSLTELMEATGKRISDLGIDEIDEGALRMAASDIAADRAEELTAAGLTLGARGVVGMGIAAHSEDLAAAMEEMGVEEAGVEEKRAAATTVKDDTVKEDAAVDDAAVDGKAEDDDSSDEENLNE